MSLNKEQDSLIKEALRSSDVCSEWKDKIKRVFPDQVRIDLQVGTWYKNNLSLICLTEIEYNKYAEGGINHTHYGFHDGEWSDKGSWANTEKSKELVPATHLEIQQALLKEAKKRGFKRGIKFRMIKANIGVIPTTKITDVQFNYLQRNNELELSTMGGYFTVFMKGQWAIPLKQMSRKDAEAKLGVIIKD